MFKLYTGKITKLKENQIFVFGSNTQGRHGKGAALFAVQQCGAKYGQSEGLQGRSYAIVTKDLTKTQHPSVSKEKIIEQIKKLYKLAFETPDKEYCVAYKGRGKNLNGYSPKEMALMFLRDSGPVPPNMVFEIYFVAILEEGVQWWLWPFELSETSGEYRDFIKRMESKDWVTIIKSNGNPNEPNQNFDIVK